MVYIVEKEAKIMQTRKTFQKSLTLEAVREMQNHPTADQVYTFVSQKYPEISRATVYRNLNFLCETGEIARVKNPSGADHFDHLTSSHYHFFCTSCGNIENVTLPDLSDLDNICRQQTGCSCCHREVVFDGVCSKCSQK